MKERPSTSCSVFNMAHTETVGIVRDFYGSWNIGHTNFVFKLHYLVSFVLLSIFITSTTFQLFENNYVNCIGTKGDKEDHIDRFAYYFSTFTLIEGKDGNMNDNIIIHNYYLWVPVMFIYQLCVFRWTYYVWQRRGGNLLKRLYEDKNKTKMFVKYIAKRIENKENDVWLFQLMFLEFQNILVCAHQWITTNRILDGKFYQLGLDLSLENLKLLFPYETKFTFKTFGPSGTIQVKDYLCILGLNALYKFIFLFYWWWLVFLTTLTVLNFMYRIVLMVYHPKTWFWEKFTVTWLRANKDWFTSLRYSDWVFLNYLHTNVSLGKHRAVVRYLVKKNLRRQMGQDISSQSSDDNGKEVDSEGQNEHRRRYRELLRTIMHPVPVLTDSDNDAVDKSEAVPLLNSNNKSGKRNNETESSLLPVATHSISVDDGNSQQPEADRLLENTLRSESSSSKIDAENGNQLNFRGKSVHSRP